MRRFIRYDNLGNVVGEISQNDIMTLVRREQINGEHSLEITTFQVLNKNERVLYQDGRGIWREYVVVGIDEEHASGKRVIGTYYCVWSVQPDLMGVPVSVMPGVQTPVSRRDALTAALSTQSRWQVGTVDNTTTGGASMYDTNAWNALSILVENWSGEITPSIEVSNNTGVVARYVDCYDQQGNQTAKRRFDFGDDLASVKRTRTDEPYYCRISPRGKGEQTEGGGYGRKITIESVNDGKDYLEYAPMVNVSKIPDGNGFIYPTLIVENSDCETPAELKTWAQGVLEDYCTPTVSYEINAVQAATEGIDVQGVSLGDAVYVVDKYFEGMRISGRVVEMTVDELNDHDMTIVIGHVQESLANQFSSLAGTVDKVGRNVSNLVTELSSAEYIENLINRLNDEINATGGYTYIVPGIGMRTYDVEVDDPSSGLEANKVVEIKGGSIRIAASKENGNWKWTSVFDAGHIAVEAITTIDLHAGYISSADGNSYWDLDANHLVTNNIDADGTLTSSASSSKVSINGGSMQFFNRASSSDSWEDAGTFSGAAGVVTPSKRYIGINYTTPYVTVGSYRYRTEFAVNQAQAFFGCKQYGQSGYSPSIEMACRGYSTDGGIGIDAADITINPSNMFYIQGDTDILTSLTVHGTKSRIAETENYGTRALYCYETPTPLFGDIGSGQLDDEGFCVVEIDDVFSETVRTDYGYQVFLQKCGQGEIWVDEKKPGYFIVRGTPKLRFDWEIKARQSDFADKRIDDHGLETALDEERSYGNEIEGLYSEEFGYVEEMEMILHEAA